MVSNSLQVFSNELRKPIPIFCIDKEESFIYQYEQQTTFN